MLPRNRSRAPKPGTSRPNRCWLFLSTSKSSLVVIPLGSRLGQFLDVLAENPCLDLAFAFLAGRELLAVKPDTKIRPQRDRRAEHPFKHAGLDVVHLLLQPTT